ncbi:cation:proton antiporter family protein [Myceligenerans salitolerans]|uniref:Cation:proton antiporter n=1 Tax=Myceligenerans salitolerans TaxID=1230528 RepID=A0ABS3I7S9_9MICO|nr:cation:proton antiporter family protein [Myceligenerans salitolerans]MBO0608162.1 cation:proton antiporter [Myceligenerans salitolerans]
MVTAATFLLVTTALGLGAHLLRLPPLVGFLVAGFVLHAAGFSEPGYLETVAELGVTLLLFGIGLKLDLRSLLRKEVWLTTFAHLLVSVAIAIGFLGALGSIGLSLLAGKDFGTLALIGLALSFSSTVFVVKVLDGRSDQRALYGRIAIGVLIMQDLIAVVFVSVTEEEPPSPWALALVLLVPAAWLLRKAWSHMGHGELQALFGIAVALGPGYALFDLVGLKGDLGALVMGVLLAGHANSTELSRNLFTLKELLLVGFFVSIGFAGEPSGQTIVVGLLVLLMLPLQGLVTALLLRLMHLRKRTAILTGLVLTNYSEFGLIVVAVGAEAGLLAEDWVVVLAVAVALSFVLASALNTRGNEIAIALASRFPSKPNDWLHREERLIDVSGAEALVLGMGRIGRGAFRQLADDYGMNVIGVEHDPERVAALRADGYAVVQADATDIEFWGRVRSTGNVRLAILAMPFHQANLIALGQLRAGEFSGTVAAVARYDDDVAELGRHGADAVFHLYGTAGLALADHAVEAALGYDAAEELRDAQAEARREPDGTPGRREAGRSEAGRSAEPQ